MYGQRCSFSPLRDQVLLGNPLELDNISSLEERDDRENPGRVVSISLISCGGPRISLEPGTKDFPRREEKKLNILVFTLGLKGLGPQMHYATFVTCRVSGARGGGRGEMVEGAHTGTPAFVNNNDPCRLHGMVPRSYSTLPATAKEQARLCPVRLHFRKHVVSSSKSQGSKLNGKNELRVHHNLMILEYFLNQLMDVFPGTVKGKTENSMRPPSK
ncbi:hypothetical protein MJT46_016057 [Ovis ammon polii x Ovis aries]|nr:hypothetical protein MJT46_016057 [Ovis ammon polii x Ovis aries]